MGTFGSNGEEVGGHTYRFYEADNRKSGAAEGIQEVGDYQGGSSVGNGGNSVINDLHRDTTGYGVTVGDAAADF